MKESDKSVMKLAETIHSLLGLKARLTPNWVDSVCHIVKTLHSRGPQARLAPEKPKSEMRSMDCDAEEINDDLVISRLKDEIASLNRRINELGLQRRQVLNEYLDMKGNIRVLCRLRPVFAGESLGHSRPVASLDSNKVFLAVDGSKSKSYSFDRVFHPSSSQDEVFKEIEPVMKSALDGYNACIFAYGQTGTGKTFTMEGSLNNPGVVPRTIQALLKQASESNYKYLFSFSMLEIYLGNLRDLLVPQPIKPTDPMPPSLTILTDPNGGIYIENLVAIPVTDHVQALRLYRLGCRFRSTASTNSNLTSSRSHCLIRISITCSDARGRRQEANKVWLIDLGGSERVLKTKASGKRLEEGKAINLSLSALGDVIYSLQRKKAHIPFRNSKLTQVLKDSLGEDSKTLMLVHVSPKEEDLCETICTLNFAARVRSVCLGNEDPAEKAQKEAAMENLQEKITSIENERRKMRGEVEKLNTKLRSLTNIDPDEHLASGDHQVNPDIINEKIKDVRVDSSSKLPGFMRPTVCSRWKSGTNQQIIDEKQLVQTRRRREPSGRAKSMIYAKKSGSEYNSHRSISGASCLVGLNMKKNADVETQCSIDTSEYDIKMAVVSEEKKPKISYRTSRTDYSMQHLKVDKWLQSRVTKSRRVPVVPLPLKQKVNEEKRSKGSELNECYNKEEVATDEGGSSCLTIEVEMDEARMEPTNLLVSEDHVVDTEKWFDASCIMENDNDVGDVCFYGLGRENADFSKKEMQAMQVLEEFCASDVIWKLEPYKQETLFEMNIEDAEGIASLNIFKVQKRTSPLDLQHRRALFSESINQKNASISTQNVQSHGDAHNAGICHQLLEKVQIICASALLGLRIQSLGFGDDFFHGLTL